MSKHLALSAGTAAVALLVSIMMAPSAARSQEPAANGAPAAQAKGKGGGKGKAALPAGPVGPTPRLSDGKPDLTGIWNGQRTVSQDGPYLQPWAQKLLDQRAISNYADDFEARCLPGGPPRAAPYHTSLVSTPTLVLMLFEGN